MKENGHGLDQTGQVLIREIVDHVSKLFNTEDFDQLAHFLFLPFVSLFALPDLVKLLEVVLVVL